MISIVRSLVAAGASTAMAVGALAAGDYVDVLDAPARQSELAAKSQLIAITGAGDRLVAAGMRGHIVYSDDGGSSWTQARVPVSATLTDLSFASASHGWAVGHSGAVLHSSDGGENWEVQTDGRRTADDMLPFYQELADEGDELAAQLVQVLPMNWAEGPEQPWLGVLFESEQHGYVVGAFNLMIETRDGGATWTPWTHRVDNPYGLHLNDIVRVGDALFMPSETGVIFRKRDGEDAFAALQTEYTGSFFGLCGNEQLMLAYGLRGTVYASYNLGEAWEALPPSINVAYTACTADGEDGFLLAAASGQIASVKLESGVANISMSESAPWPLAGIAVNTDNVAVGAGMLGVWRAEK